MAPREPLDDAETMRDGHEYGGNRERRPVARWPCPVDTGSLFVWSARGIYIVKIYTYLQSRLRVHEK